MTRFALIISFGLLLTSCKYEGDKSIHEAMDDADAIRIDTPPPAPSRDTLNDMHDTVRDVRNKRDTLRSRP